MKKVVLIIIVLFISNREIAQPLLKNQQFVAYFAAWKNIDPNATNDLYQEPIGESCIWATSNEASMMFVAEASVKKTSDSYIGEYAALIQTVQLGTTKGSGTLFTGKFDLDIINPLNSTKFGVPFTDKPVYLKGFYKYLPAENDSCRIASYLTKWNSNTHQRMTIAAASISYEQSRLVVSTYTEFDIVYTYYSAESPDSIQIIFASSADGANYNAAIGSKLYIDEISLEYFPLEVDQIKVPKDFLVCPNPVSEYLVIKSKYSPKDVQIKIFSSNGSLIKTKNIENTFDKLSITELQVGIYIYEIVKPDGMTETGKFIKK